MTVSSLIWFLNVPHKDIITKKIIWFLPALKISALKLAVSEKQSHTAPKSKSKQTFNLNQSVSLLTQHPLEGQDQNKEVFPECKAPCLAKSKHSISAQTPHANCQAWCWRSDDLGLFCNHRTWALFMVLVNHELCCKSKHSRVKCEAICPTAEACLKLGQGTRHRSLAQQQLYESMAAKEKNKDVQWPSQSPNLNLMEP